MAETRLLIADGNPVVRDALRSILRPHSDIEVVGEATDGQEAVRKVEKLQPDVLLVDVQMPGIGGVEATRRVKERLSGNHVKVLLLTVHPHHVEEALAIGADGYLMKDCGRRELLQAIRELAHRVDKVTSAAPPAVQGSLQCPFHVIPEGVSAAAPAQTGRARAVRRRWELNGDGLRHLQ